MSDPIQTILVLAIIVVTILLVVLGIQIYRVLKEFQKTVVKTNKILDHAESISHNISEPVEIITSLVAGIKTGSSLLKMIKNKIKSFDGEDDGA